jgi:hypothetical protein
VYDVSCNNNSCDYSCPGFATYPGPRQMCVAC